MEAQKMRKQRRWRGDGSRRWGSLNNKPHNLRNHFSKIDICNQTAWCFRFSLDELIAGAFLFWRQHFFCMHLWSLKLYILCFRGLLYPSQNIRHISLVNSQHLLSLTKLYTRIWTSSMRNQFQ
jgi:hypothetical protein